MSDFTAVGVLKLTLAALVFMTFIPGTKKYYCKHGGNLHHPMKRKTHFRSLSVE